MARPQKPNLCIFNQPLKKNKSGTFDGQDESTVVSQSQFVILGVHGVADHGAKVVRVVGFDPKAETEL